MNEDGNESEEFGDRDDLSDDKEDSDKESPLKEFSDGGSHIKDE